MKFIAVTSRRKAMAISGSVIVIGLLIVVPWALDARRPRILPVPPNAVEVNGGVIDTTTGLTTVSLSGNQVQEALAFYEKALTQDGWTVQRVVAMPRIERDHTPGVRVKPQVVQTTPAILADGQANYALRATRHREGGWTIAALRDKRNLPNERTLISMQSDRGVRRQTAATTATP